MVVTITNLESHRLTTVAFFVGMDLVFNRVVSTGRVLPRAGKPHRQGAFGLGRHLGLARRLGQLTGLAVRLIRGQSGQDVARTARFRRLVCWWRGLWWYGWELWARGVRLGN